jgi:hypothetical protein
MRALNARSAHGLTLPHRQQCIHISISTLLHDRCARSGTERERGLLGEDGRIVAPAPASVAACTSTSREARRAESDLDSWSHAVSSRSDDQYADSEDADSPMTRLDSRGERGVNLGPSSRTQQTGRPLALPVATPPPQPHDRYAGSEVSGLRPLNDVRG